MCLLQNKTSEFPQTIKDLTGKDLKLKLILSKDNIVSKSRLYYAVDVADTNTTSSALSAATSSSHSTSTFTDVSLHLVHNVLLHYFSFLFCQNKRNILNYATCHIQMISLIFCVGKRD